MADTIIVKVSISSSKHPELYGLVSGADSGGRPSLMRRLAEKGRMHEAAGISPQPAVVPPSPHGDAAKSGGLQKDAARAVGSFRKSFRMSKPTD